MRYQLRYAEKNLVNVDRFELSVSCSRSRRIARLSYTLDEDGSRGWDRTSDRRLIGPVLYRLSYTRVKH
jgi:hypothetical protein